MGATVRDNGGGDFDYKLMPEGVHVAVCDQVVMLGRQLTGYVDSKTNLPKIQEKAYIRFETPKNRLEYKDKQGFDVNRPMTIGITMTASIGKKASLRPFLEAWRGKQFTEEEAKGFDLFKLLGAPCMLTVRHNHNDQTDKTYANIADIGRFVSEFKAPDGSVIKLEKPVAENPLVRYSEETEEDKASFPTLQEWLQKKIMAQVKEHPAIPDQAENAGGGAAREEFPDDDIPFITNAGDR